MSKRLVFVLVLMVLTLFGLSACTPCDMVEPGLVSPDWREVLDPSAAILDWNYTDTCAVDNFEINLSKDSSFSVIEHSGTVAGSVTTWPAPTLDDAEEFFWRVRAVDEGENGPWSLELRSFFTGPFCNAADLVNPTTIYPANGGIYDNDYDSLEWVYPSTLCIPESYRVEASMDSGFVDDTFNGATGTPGTRWGFGSTPPAATQFWWRVTAFSDGAYGPPSTPRSFFTAPICPSASLVQAVPLTPLDNEFVPVGNPEFTWSYPDSSCAPEGFRLRIYNTWDWASTVMDAYNPNIATRSFQAGIPLPDCNDYMWQITMISEGMEGPLNIGQRFIVDSGSCDCAPGASTIPVLTDPISYSILLDTNAELRWYNPGGCFSDGQSLKLSPDYDFTDSSRDVIIPHPFNVGFDPPGLDPATQYYWKVANYVSDGGTEVIGDFSSKRSFFTGPECTSITEVMPPEIYLPEDGAVVNTLVPALRYRPGLPGCIPDGYYLNLQTDPVFGGTNLLGEFMMPATTVFPEPVLTDCTTYYFKVNGIQGGVYGPESDVVSFFVDETGTCLPPGVPGTAKSNFFCREGTFEVFDPLWTVENGHRVLAIARNPLTTYLKITILDQVTKEPFKHEIRCWSYIGNIEPGWPETPEGMEYFFGDLPVLNPPPTLVPTEVPACHLKMNQKDCKVSGGTYDTNKNVCQCP